VIALFCVLCEIPPARGAPSPAPRVSGFFRSARSLSVELAGQRLGSGHQQAAAGFLERRPKGNQPGKVGVERVRQRACRGGPASAFLRFTGQGMGQGFGGGRRNRSSCRWFGRAGQGFKSPILHFGRQFSRNPGNKQVCFPGFFSFCGYLPFFAFFKARSILSTVGTEGVCLPVSMRQRRFDADAGQVGQFFLT